MPRKTDTNVASTPPIMESTTANLVQIVTKLGDATKHLSAGEREAYEDAQRSVVEARHCGESMAEHIHVL